LAGADLAFKDARLGPASLEGLRVLVVDDETDTLDLITVELAEHGAIVTGAATAAEALKTLAAGKIDLLISDIGMPAMDGYDLIRELRQQEISTGKHLPAVALTAYARVQDRMRAIMAGYSTHVAKPVDVNELVTVVASLAGRIGKN